MGGGFYRALISPFKMEGRAKSASLYQKLGGEPAIDRVVEHLYQEVLGDHHLNGFFAHVCMHYQRYKLKVFLTMALGGPVRYTGKDLRSAHARLVEQGLNDSHFDRILTHLRSTLELLKLESHEIEEVMAITESTRNDVLGR
ncbi:MAG: group I truncated hemoglobin [Gammaproteobacteria bacterium]